MGNGVSHSHPGLTTQHPPLDDPGDPPGWLTSEARLRLLPENRSGQYRLIPDVEHGPHGSDAKERI